MKKRLKNKDLLKLSDLSRDELSLVLDTAHAFKIRMRTGVEDGPLERKKVAIILQKPSLRTRVSFEVGIHALGAQPVVLAGTDSAFSRGESTHDTVKTLERYVDAIVLRTYEDSFIEEVARHADIPVINALTDGYHPCQALADLLTIQEEFGTLKGLTLAFVGDGFNNMAHSYLEAGALTGMNVRIGAPSGYHPDKAILARTQELARETGATLTVVTDPVEAVEGADIVAADTWTSMGQEEERERRLKDLAAFQVDEKLMAHAKDTAIFLHCLPAHRGEEVTCAVMDGPASRVFDEAENRTYVQAALLQLLLEEVED